MLLMPSMLDAVGGRRLRIRETKVGREKREEEQRENGKMGDARRLLSWVGKRSYALPPKEEHVSVSGDGLGEKISPAIPAQLMMSSREVPSRCLRRPLGKAPLPHLHKVLRST